MSDSILVCARSKRWACKKANPYWVQTRIWLLCSTPLRPTDFAFIHLPWISLWLASLWLFVMILFRPRSRWNPWKPCQNSRTFCARTARHRPMPLWTPSPPFSWHGISPFCVLAVHGIPRMLLASPTSRIIHGRRTLRSRSRKSCWRRSTIPSARFVCTVSAAHSSSSTAFSSSKTRGLEIGQKPFARSVSKFTTLRTRISRRKPSRSRLGRSGMPSSQCASRPFSTGLSSLWMNALHRRSRPSFATTFRNARIRFGSRCSSPSIPSVIPLAPRCMPSAPWPRSTFSLSRMKIWKCPISRKLFLSTTTSRMSSRRRPSGAISWRTFPSFGWRPVIASSASRRRISRWLTNVSRTPSRPRRCIISSSILCLGRWKPKFFQSRRRTICSALARSHRAFSSDSPTKSMSLQKANRSRKNLFSVITWRFSGLRLCPRHRLSSRPKALTRQNFWSCCPSGPRFPTNSSALKIFRRRIHLMVRFSKFNRWQAWRCTWQRTCRRFGSWWPNGSRGRAQNGPSRWRLSCLWAKNWNVPLGCRHKKNRKKCVPFGKRCIAKRNGSRLKRSRKVCAEGLSSVVSKSFFSICVLFDVEIPLWYFSVQILCRSRFVAG